MTSSELMATANEVLNIPMLKEKADLLMKRGGDLYVVRKYDEASALVLKGIECLKEAKKREDNLQKSRGQSLIVRTISF